MSDTYFSRQSARITEICRLNRDDMWQIIEHASCPVDRVSLAQGCRKRMAGAAWVLSRYGPRRIRGVNEELGGSVKFTLRTIDWLLRPHDEESEAERLVELESARPLAEVIALIVEAEALKIPHLQELYRALFQLKSRAFDVGRASRNSGVAFLKLDENSRFTVECSALELGYLLDDVRSEVPHKIFKLRRPRQRPTGEPSSQPSFG
jgi:hypothetical protein